MSNAAYLLLKLEKHFKITYSDLFTLFNKGIEPENEIKCESLKDLYKWNNGITITSETPLGKYEFCSWGYFLPYSQAKSFQDINNESGYYENKSYLPFISSLAGEELLVDISIENSAVLIYSKALLINDPIEIFTSIDHFIETVYYCFKLGAYKYDKSYYLKVDDNLETRIAKRINKNSEYWLSI